MCDTGTLGGIPDEDLVVITGRDHDTRVGRIDGKTPGLTVTVSPSDLSLVPVNDLVDNTVPATDKDIPTGVLVKATCVVRDTVLGGTLLDVATREDSELLVLATSDKIITDARDGHDRALMDPPDLLARGPVELIEVAIAASTEQGTVVEIVSDNESRALLPSEQQFLVTEASIADLPLLGALTDRHEGLFILRREGHVEEGAVTAFLARDSTASLSGIPDMHGVIVVHGRATDVLPGLGPPDGLNSTDTTELELVDQLSIIDSPNAHKRFLTVLSSGNLSPAR